MRSIIQWLALSMLATASCAFGATGTVGCQDGTPATPAPEFGPAGEMMWPAEMQPADQGPLPAWRDSTQYTGQQLPGNMAGYGLELFTDLDIEETDGHPYLYMAYNSGWQLWDIGGPWSANPRRLSYREGWDGKFHRFQILPTEFYFLIWGIDAIDTPDSETLVAVAGTTPVGISIWRAGNKFAPVQIYQDYGRAGRRVATVHINGQSYALLANSSSTTGGVHVYNMTRALEIGPCFEDTTSANETYCGGLDPVWRGRILPFAYSNATFLSVLTTKSGDHYVAFSDANFWSNLGVEVRRINDLADPSVGTSMITAFLGNMVLDIAFFEHRGRQYLAAIHVAEATYLDVYDMTGCLVANGCSPGSPIYRREIAFPSWTRVSWSVVQDHPMLYLGWGTLCTRPPLVGAPHSEHLINMLHLPDVPNDGRELIIGGSWIDTASGQPREINYWTSRYDGATAGLSTFGPFVGKFYGSYFYRAAFSVFDVHRWRGQRAAIFADGFESGSVVGWSD